MKSVRDGCFVCLQVYLALKRLLEFLAQLKRQRLVLLKAVTDDKLVHLFHIHISLSELQQLRLSPQ